MFLPHPRNFEPSDTLPQFHHKLFYPPPTNPGMALIEIRERKLYRDVLGYDTFEMYCKERWDFKRAHAYRLIDSAIVLENVSPIGDIKPTSESQARPLTKLEPEQQKEAWQKVIDIAPQGKITARLVSKVVSEVKKETIKKEVDKKSKKARVVPKDMLVDEEFKRAFDAFYWEVQRARLENWKTTSKEASLRFLNLIQDLIEVK
jgi:hypothetical protein